MMIKLLTKCGVPERPLRVIKTVYKDFKIELSIGKYKKYADYSTGVK